MLTIDVGPEAGEDGAADRAAGGDFSSAPVPLDDRKDCPDIEPFCPRKPLKSQALLEQFSPKLENCTCSFCRIHVNSPWDAEIFCNLYQESIHKIYVNVKHKISVKHDISLKEFGQRLKQIREALGLSQGGLGEKVGLKWYQIQHLELGKAKKIPLDLLGKIVELGISPKWFSTGEGEMFLRKGPEEEGGDHPPQPTEVVHDHIAWWDMVEVEGPYPTTLSEAMQDPTIRKEILQYAQMNPEERRAILSAIEDPATRDLILLIAGMNEEEKRNILQDIKGRKLLKMIIEEGGVEELKTLLQKKTGS